MLLDLGDDALKVLLAVAIIWSSPFWAPLLVGIVCGVLPGLWWVHSVLIGVGMGILSSVTFAVWFQLQDFSGSSWYYIFTPVVVATVMTLALCISLSVRGIVKARRYNHAVDA